MNSPCLFKLFEYCLLPVLQSHTSISPLQFGYRPNTSTVLATTILKETVNKFLEEDSLVYACFLDLSKAFERVDHKILIEKLLNDNVPLYIINILRTLFKNTEVCVHFNGFFSSSWQIRQGVRHCGVLSAYLFTYYIDNILKCVLKKMLGAA